MALCQPHVSYYFRRREPRAECRVPSAECLPSAESAAALSKDLWCRKDEINAVHNRRVEAWSA